jgi:hypothetical protein
VLKTALSMTRYSAVNHSGINRFLDVTNFGKGHPNPNQCIVRDEFWRMTGSERNRWWRIRRYPFSNRQRLVEKTQTLITSVLNRDNHSQIDRHARVCIEVLMNRDTETNSSLSAHLMHLSTKRLMHDYRRSIRAFPEN